MKDPLMEEFLTVHPRMTADSFSQWRLFCADSCERHGQYHEFIGRVERCRQSLARKRIPNPHGTSC